MNSPQAADKLTFSARLLAFTVVLLGIMVIFGWLTDIQALKQIHPSFVSMKFNTALLFAFSGLATLCLCLSRIYLATGLSLFIFFCALTTSLQDLMSLDFGIDTLFVDDPALVRTKSPGRMSLNSAVSFMITSLGILLMALAKERRLNVLIGGILSSITLALGVAALLGYALNLDWSSGWGRYSAMALHTAFGFILLGTALTIQYWIITNRKNAKQSNFHHLLIPLSFLLLVINLSISTALKVEQQNRIRDLLSSQLQAVVGETTTIIQTYAYSLNRMAKRWQIREGTPKEEWRADAAEYIHSHPELRAVAWVDSNFIAQWVEPEGTDPTVRNFNLGSEKNRLTALLDAQRNKRPAISKNVELVRGGQGFLIIAPITINQQSGGFIVGAIDIDQFLTRILERTSSPLFLQLKQNDYRIFFEGGSAPGPGEISHTLAMKLDSLNWQFNGSASTEWIDKQSSALPIIVFLSGLTFTLLIVTAIHFLIQASKLRKVLIIEEQRFRMIVESIPSVLILIGDDGVIELINAQAEKTFGYQREELVGKKIECLIPEKYRKHHPKQRNAFLGKPVARPMGEGLSLFALNKSGDEFPVEIALNPIKVLSGNKVLVSILNISEREKYVNELKRSNKELNDFAYVASHDLKAPLRAIEQLTGWLSEDLEGVINQQATDHIALIKQRIRRMEKLLDDLLAYSRSGKKESIAEEVNVENLVEETFALCNHDSSFTLEYHGEVGNIMLVRSPLETIFRNLFSNAVKHHDQPTGKIVVTAQLKTASIDFEVADDGPGIPEQYRGRVMGMFQTLKPRDEIEGSGMGLAIVEKILTAFGSKIILSTNSPRGAKFNFSWPLDTPDQAPS